MPIGKLKKEDLLDAGLNLDELTTKLGSIPDETKIKGIVEGSVQDIIKNQLAGLESTLTTKMQETIRTAIPNKDNNNNNNNNNNQNQDPDPVTFMDDPMTHTRKVVNEAMSAVRGETLKFMSETSFRTAKEKLEYFKIPAVEEEIKAEWDKYPLALKANPDVLIKNIYDMVVGRHITEIQMDTNKKEGKYNLIQSSSGSNQQQQNNNTSKKPEEELTQEELSAAKTFGMTPKEYSDFKAQPGVRYA